MPIAALHRAVRKTSSKPANRLSPHGRELLLTNLSSLHSLAENPLLQDSFKALHGKALPTFDQVWDIAALLGFTRESLCA